MKKEYNPTTFEHYKKTGRTPFSMGNLYEFRDENELDVVISKFDDKYSRFVELMEQITDKDERRKVINRTYDLLTKLIGKSKTTNYKEYFESLQEKIHNLKEGKQDNDNTTKKFKPIPFEELFTKKEYASKVIEKLKEAAYLDDSGKWNGTGKKADFKYMFMALKNQNKINYSIDGLKSFYIGFGFRIVDKIEEQQQSTLQIVTRAFTGDDFKGFEPPFDGGHAKENKYQKFSDLFFEIK